jgi:hypothetical protein
MKNKLFYIASLLILSLTVFGAIQAVKLFNEKTISITTNHMPNGDICYLAITNSGAALSCTN